MPEHGRKIFGVGLSKTGTYSTHRAMQILGLRSQHWEYTKRTIRYSADGVSVDLSMFEQDDCFFDTPIARVYRTLDDAFPGSKFILTWRDVDDWLRSYKRFFSARPELDASGAPDLISDLYGTHGHDEQILRNAYLRHNSGVREYFRDRPADLLSLQVGSGDEWQAICEFLSLPVPDVDFPRENTHVQRRPSRSRRALAALRRRLPGVGGA